MNTSETPQTGEAAFDAAKTDSFADNKRNFGSDIAGENLRNLSDLKSTASGVFLNKLKNPPKEPSIFDILGSGRSGHT